MNKYYDIVKSIIENDATVPEWIKNSANSFPYVFNGTEFPRIGDVILTEEYLASLKRHAEIEGSFPGGLDWANKLHQRHKALLPYANKLILSVSVHFSTNYALLYVDPETPRLIACETYEMRATSESEEQD